LIRKRLEKTASGAAPLQKHTAEAKSRMRIRHCGGIKSVALGGAVVTWLALGMAAGGPVPSLSASTSPLLQQTNLVYEGGFRLPFGYFGGSSFDYGGSAMAFNPVNSSLYFVGHDHQQMVAEIAIPSPVNSSRVDDLPVATVLQPFRDATEGRLGDRKIG
jgi:hypothetical protein